jgi:ribA/ribD-fused uncharacterized protein
MGGPGHCDGKTIGEFDNFYVCKFVIHGVEYCSTENYFQCQKTTNKEDFELLFKSGPGIKVWSNSRKVKLRDNWEEDKVEVMYKANYEKFAQNDDLKKILVDTDGKIKFSASTEFWCLWNSRILARVRAELRSNGENDKKTIEEIKNLMEEYSRKFKKGSKCIIY